MPADLRILTFRDLLQVTNVSIVEGLPIRTVRVEGLGFHKASLARMNGLFAPDIVVLSDQALLAEVPFGIGDQPIRTVEVFSAHVDPLEDTAIDFAMTPARRSEGAEKLLQAFLLRVMAAPGSDLYSPEDGGGIRTLLGSNVSGRDRSGLMGRLHLAVARTQEQLMEEQSDGRLPLDERMGSAEVLSTSFDPDSTTVMMVVRVTSMAGTSATAALEA